MQNTLNIDDVRHEMRKRIRIYDQLIERHSPKDGRDPSPTVLMYKASKSALNELSVALGIQL